MKNEYKYLVRVNCITYNHALYIKDALNGFCMQNTTFPFICIIVDDASTDGEPVIINKYLEEHFNLEDKLVAWGKETDDYYLTFAQHKTNNNCFFAVFCLKYNHYSIKKSKNKYFEDYFNAKYIAMCEGDDYWTNPNKLNSQVKFMESNPDYSMCYGDVERYDCNKSKSLGNYSLLCNNRYLNNTEYSKEKILYKIITRDVIVATQTVLIRSEILKNIKSNNVSFMMGDTPLWIDLSQVGKLWYEDVCYGIYRIHNGSATHNNETRARFTLSCKEMDVYYCNKYGYSIPSLIKREYNHAYFNIVFSNTNISPNALYPPFYTGFLKIINVKRLYADKQYFNCWSRIFGIYDVLFGIKGKIMLVFKVLIRKIKSVFL